jgi:GNAT superfamily N-acetyltransferase
MRERGADSPGRAEPPAGSAWEVRQADAGDGSHLAAVLARAFRDDPVQRWLFPSDADWARGSPRLFRATLRVWTRFGVVHTSADRAGAAIWVPPGPPRVPRSAEWRLSVEAILALRRRTALAARAFARMEHHHPKEPHWYLMVLGTEPRQQGRGVGSALLRPTLERCDREGTLAWLESSKERNLPFYRGHGFELVETLPLPGGGPPVWLMRRPPRGGR